MTTYTDCCGEPIVLERHDPPPLTSADRRHKIALYRSIVRDLRQKSSREGRPMTWGERANVRQLLDDIAVHEAAEESTS